MLVDVPLGASPAGGACSVATVVMLDNGKGDRPAESVGVKVSVGWVEAQSDPPAILLGYVFFARFIRKQGLRYFRVQTEIELAEQIHRSLVPPIVRHASRDEFYGLSAPSGEMVATWLIWYNTATNGLVIWQMFPATACRPAY